MIWAKDEDWYKEGLRKLVCQGRSGHEIRFWIVPFKYKSLITNLGSQVYIHECYTYVVELSESIIQGWREKYVLKEEFSVMERMGEEDIRVIEQNWAHTKKHPEGFICKRSEKGGAFAVKKGAEMVAWVLVREDDALGTLFVKPEYRRFGLAKIIVTRTCELLFR